MSYFLIFDAKRLSLIQTELIFFKIMSNQSSFYGLAYKLCQRQMRICQSSLIFSGKVLTRLHILNMMLGFIFGAWLITYSSVVIKIKFVIMNFFDGDFGLGSMSSFNQKPLINRYRKGKNMDQLSFKSAKKDEFDDLLDDMLNKHEKKANKNKEKDVIQPYSSSFLDPPPPPFDLKKTEKWSTPNIDGHNFHHDSPKFPNSRMNSMVDDKGSEDGRSYKSGFTRQNQQQQFDNLITLRGPQPFKQQPPALQRSARSMMRPPLAKKQSRENLSREKETSIINDETSLKFSRAGGVAESGTLLDLGFSNFDRPRYKESKPIIPVPEEKIKERIVEKQKIVTVREEATELKRQFENEVRQIKQSYERQLKFAMDKLKEQVQQAKKQKLKLIKEHQLQLEDQKSNWRRLSQQNASRVKQLHQWELKRKCETYQLEIQKLKSMSQLEDTISKQQNAFQVGQESQQLRSKQRELQAEMKKIEELKFHLEQRERTLQSQQRNFENYRRREEEKLQMEKRELLERQNQWKKNELQSKRLISLEKQKLSYQIANSQLELIKKKESINLEKEQVRINKELLQKQKMEFQNFNKHIINDYRNKLKELQSQREHLNQLEIELHKKIHTVEMAGDTKGIKPTTARASFRPSSSNQENRKNRANSQIEGKINSTKQRFQEMQLMARKLTAETQEERQKMREKVNVSGYIARLNRALSKH